MAQMGDSNCNFCFKQFDDEKSIVECTGCKKLFHAKCEAVVLRGFHLRKSTWLCRQCRRGQDDEMIRELFEMVKDLTKATAEMQSKLNNIMEENRNLREEVTFLKNNINSINLLETNEKTYSSVVKNKSLIVKPKKKIDDLNKTKIELKNKIKPAEMGIGITMKGGTKDGGVVLQYDGNKDIKDKIQSNLGQNYEVFERNVISKYRMRIAGISGDEYEQPDGSLIENLICQNDLNINPSDVKIIHRSKLKNEKFGLSIEMDKGVYEDLKSKERVFIGWSRCGIYDDFGMIRCYKCWGFGHFARVCRSEICCPKCAGGHRGVDCESEVKKCINCLKSNKKFKLNLNINHDVWDKNCATFQRMVEQRRKYVNSGQI